MNLRPTACRLGLSFAPVMLVVALGWALPAVAQGAPTAAPAASPANVAPPAEPAVADIAPQGMGERTPGEVGALHRLSATLESVLDLYRLALIELAPAVEMVWEAGSVAGANTQTRLPAPAIEIFTRLGQTLGRRIPASALPPIPRAYHAEVVDALDVVGAQDTIGGTAEPLRLLVHALDRFARSADDIIDLFSRQRPIRAKVVDEGVLYDEMADALEEFANAEQEIRKRRKQKASQDAIAGAFRRTEIALGHVLDLWAVARTMGINFAAVAQPVVDFKVEPQILTTELEHIAGRMRVRLQRLTKLVEKLTAAPPPIPAATASAWLREGGQDNTHALVSWSLPHHGRENVGEIRIYRGEDPASLESYLYAALTCGGMTPEEARKNIDSALTELPMEPVLLASIASGRTSYTDNMKAVPITPPVYGVSAVSPFGIESQPAVTATDYVPREFEGVMGVDAAAHGVPPEDPRFYLMGDAVRVGWRLSRNDVAGDPTLEAQAHGDELPIVARYDVQRITDGKAKVIARVPAGTFEVTDRPGPKALQQGVRYRVFAISGRDTIGKASESCGQSPMVKHDVTPQFALARAGIGNVPRPTRTELATKASLTDGALLERARKTWLGRAPHEKAELLTRWWRHQPRERRDAWLQTWPALFGPKGSKAFVRTFDGALSARDLPWAQAEIFLKAQSEFVQQEVSRWWIIKTAERQKAELDTWLATLNPAHGAWVKEQWDPSGMSDRQRPARVLAWWRSRDELEHRDLAAWWEALGPETQQQEILTWWKTLPPPAQAAVRWTDWSHLSPAEREARRDHAPAPLPDGLFADFEAWRQWEEASAKEKLAAARREAGWLGRTSAGLLYSLRPVDARLGFRLWFWFFTSLFGSVAVVLTAAGLLTRRRPEDAI